jgi:hypothetical protein
MNYAIRKLGPTGPRRPVGTKSPTEAQVTGWRRFPPKSHPLVWTHRSGRKSLVRGTHASHVDGMELEEGRASIKRLMDWATVGAAYSSSAPEAQEPALNSR